MAAASPGRRVGVAVVLLAATALGPVVDAQRADDPPALAALREYLAAYEPRLSVLIAEERFVQFEERPYRRRRLRQETVSEIGFLRLPGSPVWLGQRRVQRLNGRRLHTTAPTLDVLFGASGDDQLRHARAIADENARHNLGAARSINVPTLPLDLLDARHAAAFAVTTGADRVIRGVPTTLLTLEERPPGRLVGFEDVRFRRSDVRAWIAPDGTLVEAEVDLHPPVPLRHDRHMIRVRFARDAALDLFVPVELEEEAPRFTGRATYGRFRRFGTSARVVP